MGPRNEKFIGSTLFSIQSSIFIVTVVIIIIEFLVMGRQQTYSNNNGAVQVNRNENGANYTK